MQKIKVNRSLKMLKKKRFDTPTNNVAPWVLEFLKKSFKPLVCNSVRITNAFLLIDPYYRCAWIFPCYQLQCSRKVRNVYPLHRPQPLTFCSRASSFDFGISNSVQRYAVLSGHSDFKSKYQMMPRRYN